MMESTGNTTFWNPLGYLKPSKKESCIAVVILNRPLELLQLVLESLWNKAVLKVAVDGGVNRLESLPEGHYLPDLVTGDFDSCTSEALERLKQKGVTVIPTPEQDNTDFTKCLKIVADKVNDNEACESVMVLGAFGGRLDHVMANINTLFTAQEFLRKPVAMFDEDSVAFLLQPGHHVIKVNTGLEGDCCGLIPVGSSCKDVSTTGLKWNLDHSRMSFGDLISTSNTYDGSDEVTVSCSDPLLWTMGYRI